MPPRWGPSVCAALRAILEKRESDQFIPQKRQGLPISLGVKSLKCPGRLTMSLLLSIVLFYLLSCSLSVPGSAGVPICTQ